METRGATARAIRQRKTNHMARTVVKCNTSYVLLCMVLAVVGMAQESIKYTPLFIFGDSILDAGNNNYINTFVRINFKPYGQTYFPEPTGRDSDGRLICDFIAEFANLTLLPPFLEPGKHDFSLGANFASCGAGAQDQINSGSVIPLKTQLENFKKMKVQLRKELGDEEAGDLTSRAVYMISIGGNDYLSPFIMNTSASLFQRYTHEQYVKIVVGNLTSVVKELYNQGARKFGFIGMYPLGCFPGMRQLNLHVTGKTGCHEESTELAKLHIQVLTQVLEELAVNLQGFKYSHFDTYTLVSERIANPLKYGFKEGETACCGVGPYRGFPNCGGVNPLFPKIFEQCDDPSEYLFFDQAHLTEKANKQLAEQLWSGPSAITGPYNLKALFQVVP